MKSHTAADGQIMIDEISFQPRIVMQTDKVIVFDDAIEPDGFKLIGEAVLNQKFSCLDTLIPWNNTWQFGIGQPPASSASYLRSKEPHSNYSDLVGALFEKMVKAYPAYVGKGWTDMRIHAQICGAGTKLNWHADHHCNCSFTYYVHPEWRPSWGGELMVPDCPPLEGKPPHRGYGNEWEDGKVAVGLGHYILPKPNRLVMMAPKVWHGVNRIDSDAGNHQRVAVVGFLMNPNAVGDY